MAEQTIQQNIIDDLLEGLNKQSIYFKSVDLTSVDNDKRIEILNQIGNIHTKLIAISNTDMTLTVQDIEQLKAQYLNLISNVGSGSGTPVKGDKGDPFLFSDFTLQQLEQLKGEKGKDFKYEDFTQEQLYLLKSDTIPLSSFIFGNDLNNFNSDSTWIEPTEIELWNPYQNGSNTPVFDNISLFHKFGKTSLRFGNTTAGVSTSHGKLKALSEGVDMTTTDTITIWVYVDGEVTTDSNNSSKYGSVLLVLGSNSFAQQVACNMFGTGGGGWHKGWNNVTVHKSSFTIVIAGVIDWEHIDGIKITFTPLATSVPTLFHIDSIFIGGAIKNKKVPVCITLDDSHEEAYSMTNIMNSYGVPTSLFVMPVEIDNHTTFTSSMILSQIQKLYDKGNHIGFHHSLFGGFVVNPTLMLDGKNWLIAKGFTKNNGHLYGAYPNGRLSQACIDYAKSIGILGLRSLTGSPRLDSLNFSEATTSLIHRESILNGGIADPHRINSAAPLTAAAAIAQLDNAILHKSAYLTYHHVFSEIGGKAEWETLAKYLKQKVDDGVIECITFPEFCEKYKSKKS